MKAHIFERACPLYQEGALTPIFEGDMPPKNDPKKWRQYWRHSCRPVNEKSYLLLLVSVVVV
jgi:hypothetical protein